MKTKLAIIGAGGHGRVVADIAFSMKRYSEIVFLDDAIPNINLPYPYYGTTTMAENLKSEYALFVAIGNSKRRQQIMDLYLDAEFPVLRHPSAIIGSDVTIDYGTVLMPGVIINSGTSIGKGVICNTACTIDHDCKIGDFNHISVGSHLCGTVFTGEHDWVGAGVTVSNNINICAECVIGAGAVVIKNVFESGTYVGVPARKIK